MNPTSHISTLPMLDPERVPPALDMFHRSVLPTRKPILAICHRSEERSAVEQILLIQKAHASLDIEMRPVARRESSGAVADHLNHDAYCRIRRVIGDPPSIFAISLLQAYEEMLQDQTDHGMTLDQESWWAFRRTFDALLAYVCGLPALEIHVTSIFEPNIKPPKVDALRRWVLGHHGFLVLIQGLILTFNEMDGALEREDTRSASRALALATKLMRGSSLAFRYATDYPPEDYEQIVRASMTPPQALPGFSGLLSSDHRKLVAVMKSVRPRIAVGRPPLAALARDFEAALDGTYEVHKLVCARFGGGDGPSLLRESEETAVQRLERFQQSRTRLPRFHGGRALRQDGGCPFSEESNSLCPTKGTSLEAKE